MTTVPVDGDPIQMPETERYSIESALVGVEFVYFPEWRNDFLTIYEHELGEYKQYVDRFLEHVKGVYTEQDCVRIVKALVLATIAYQRNENKTKQKRKTKDAQGNEVPTIFHALSMALIASGAEFTDVNFEQKEIIQTPPLEAVMVEAVLLHDVQEDVRLHVNGTCVEGHTWGEIIEQELHTGEALPGGSLDHGAVLRRIINGVTKYTEEELAQIQGPMRKSAIYKRFLQMVIEAYSRTHGTEPDEAELQKIHDYLDKAISSLIKMSLESVDLPDNDRDYWRILIGCFHLKCLDAEDNMRTPGTNKGAVLRARILAVYARLMGGIGTHLMKKLANESSIDSNIGVLHRTSANREMIEDLIQHDEQYREEMVALFRELDITVPIDDVVSDIPIILSSDDPSRFSATSVPQMRVAMTTETCCAFERVALGTSKRKVNKKLARELAEKYPEYVFHVEQEYQPTHEIQRFFGRRSYILRVYCREAQGGKFEPLFNIKISDMKEVPSLLQAIEKDNTVNDVRDIPEAGLWTQHWYLEKEGDVLETTLTTFSLIFDPAIVETDSRHVVVFSRNGLSQGYITIPTVSSIDELQNKVQAYLWSQGIDKPFTVQTIAGSQNIFAVKYLSNDDLKKRAPREKRERKGKRLPPGSFDNFA